jgi:hypothetical protein
MNSGFYGKALLRFFRACRGKNPDIFTAISKDPLLILKGKLGNHKHSWT